LNFIRRDGMSPDDAVIRSVSTRIRPIFMTTITTTFGLFPLVAVNGAGSELYRGLGSVVLGGMAFSTLFTLFLVPSLFSLMYRLTALLGKRPPQDLNTSARRRSSADITDDHPSGLNVTVS